MAKERKRFRFVRRIVRLAVLGSIIAAVRKKLADKNDVQPPT